MKAILPSRRRAAEFITDLPVSEWGYETADYRDALSGGGDLLGGFAVAGYEGGALYEVAGRVAADGEFGEQD
jgi:hypothetical protein